MLRAGEMKLSGEMVCSAEFMYTMIHSVAGSGGILIATSMLFTLRGSIDVMNKDICNNSKPLLIKLLNADTETLAKHESIASKRLFAITFYEFAIDIALATVACDLVTIGGQISKLRPCQAFVHSIANIGRDGTR